MTTEIRQPKKRILLTAQRKRLDWTSKMDSRLLDLIRSGLSQRAAGESMGIHHRSISSRMEKLSSPNSAVPTIADYHKEVAARRKSFDDAEKSFVILQNEKSRDDTKEWSAWELVHINKVFAPQAAKKMGISVQELYELLARQNIIMKARAEAVVLRDPAEMGKDPKRIAAGILGRSNRNGS